MIKEVFVIEDNPGDAFLVKEYLQGSDKINFNFTFFDSIKKIEAQEKNFIPDVILLDLNIIDSKGISTFEKVHKLFKSVPIIILSGYADEETAINAVKLGAQDYLIKGNINQKTLQLAVFYAIERAKLTQSLFNSEQQFRLLTENAPIFIWMTDENGKFVYCNRLLTYYLDIPEELLCEKSMLDFVSPKFVDSVSDIYKNAILSQESYSIEFELIKGISIFEKSVPYFNQTQGFMGFICTGMDLSELKKIETEKNINVAKYEFIAENSLDIIWKMDLQLNTTYCNKAIYDFLGYTPDEFVKLMPYEYLKEESLNKVNTLLTKKLYEYEETNDIENSLVEHLELEFIHKNGEIKYGEIKSKFVYDLHTDELIIMGVTRDVTEKKRIDAKIKNYQKRVEILSNCAISFLVNNEKENLFKLIGENLLLLIPNCYVMVNSINQDISTLEYIAGLGYQALKLDKLIGSAVIGRKTKLNSVALNRLGRGKLIKIDGGLFEVTLNTLSHSVIGLIENVFDIGSVYVYGMNKDSKLIGSVIIVMKKGHEPEDTDIIEAFVNQATIALNRKNAEDALKKSEQQLKDSVAAKDKFFSIISHDLRSPYQGILGYLDIITENFEEISFEELSMVLNNLKGLITNQYNLLENLLKWANIQRGKSTINKKQVALKQIVDKILGAISINAEKKGINLFTEIEENFIIEADIEMLKSIINNLVSNAIKFTKRGGSINIYAVNKKGVKYFSVADDGVGMSQAEVESLFKIDKQKSSLGTEKEKGTGLGLILCKEFVDLHGWTIKVDSKIGVGTKFTIILEEKIY